MKFSLGYQGLAIFATDYPVSTQIACKTSAPLNQIEQTITAGSSRLTCDAISDQYTCIWKKPISHGSELVDDGR